MAHLIRGNRSDKIKVLIKNEIKVISRKEFLKRMGVDGICRLKDGEYLSLAKNQRFLTLFNLQHTTHQAGKLYALAHIVKPGYFTLTKEVLPLLSFKKSPIARCLSVRNKVAYEQLSIDNFRYSLPAIQNKKQLHEAIVKKYSESVPGLSAEKLIALGVAVTRLEIIGNLKDSWNKPK